MIVEWLLFLKEGFGIFRSSLELKLGLLLFGVVVAIGLIIFLNFETSRTTTTELNRVKDLAFPRFSAANHLNCSLKFRGPLIEDRHDEALKPISIKEKDGNVALVRV